MSVRLLLAVRVRHPVRVRDPVRARARATRPLAWAAESSGSNASRSRSATERKAALRATARRLREGHAPARLAALKVRSRYGRKDPRRRPCAIALNKAESIAGPPRPPRTARPARRAARSSPLARHRARLRRGARMRYWSSGYWRHGVGYRASNRETAGAPCWR